MRASLRKSEIVAPIDRIVVERLVDPGETVEAGAAIATIIDPARVRVEAEVDEFDVASIAGFDQQWNGRVEEVPLRVVGRSIRPLDPARPVDIRVLLVGITLLENTPSKIGQRVAIEISR